MKIGKIVLLTGLLLIGWACITSAASVNSLVISEVFYDRTGGDNQYEWVELFNGSGSVIDLSEWSLGWGGGGYTYGTLSLGGSIPPLHYMVVGGPNSDPTNGDPVFDLAADFNRDLQNGGTTADGVGLFHVTADQITNTTIPFFSVIYGANNSDGLLDPSGGIGTADIQGASAGKSIAYFGRTEGWQVSDAPSPGSGPFATVPLPPAGWLLGLSLCCSAGIIRRRHLTAPVL